MLARGWALLIYVIVTAYSAGRAQSQTLDQSERSTADASAAAPTSSPDEWIDRAHEDVHAVIWRSAMYIDRLFSTQEGTPQDEQMYQQQARGSITPIVLWDQYNGLSQQFRFNVKFPLPNLDDRYDAFIGTFSRDEYVTGRDLESGAIPHQHPRGEVEEDQTLFGIRFRQPNSRGRFEATAGMRLASPVDPFVKVGYRYERGKPEGMVLRLSETVFWQSSEQFGLTSRIDLERNVGDSWFARWSASGTLSEKTGGVRGYSSLTAFRALPNRRAVGAQLFTSGEFNAAVPVGEYGVRVAYRQSIVRDWLVLEIRPSVTWPKEHPWESRQASWGLGIGFEMFFGESEFQARPATF